MKTKKWCSLFVICVVFFITICFLITYKYDPFYKYDQRKQWDKYTTVKKEKFLAVGLIKNFDYDSLLIGSSMVENFDMDYFRSKMKCNIIKVPLEGIEIKETLELLNKASEVGKAKKYYVSIDIAKFATEKEISRIPDYLLNDSFLYDLKYALNYESWFRFYPFNMPFSIVEKINLPFIPKILNTWEMRYGGPLDIDNKDNWAKYYTFDADIVLNNYNSGKYSVSVINLVGLEDRMKRNIDNFFTTLNISDAEYNFFLPPYSILFWDNAQKLGYYDVYKRVIDYFVFKAKEKNMNVYDFQTAEFISDLNNYKDTTHYSPKINNWMVDMFVNREYLR